MKDGLETFLNFKGKKVKLAQTGFYFAGSEQEEKDRVFVFYAISADNQEQITAFIQPWVVLKLIEENNLSVSTNCKKGENKK